jgi:putative FmdB family regulatory protein
MPLYTYQCPECGASKDGVASVSERHLAAPSCHGQMKLIIVPTLVMDDIAPYMAVAGDMAGKTISGRREHREYLKRNRLVEVGNEPIRPIRNDFRPRKGEIREDLHKIVPQVLARHRG